MISPRNVLRHELIGLDVLVARASNPGHVGVSGRIIDETRNTLVIRTERGEKRIPKRFSVFRFRLPDGTTVDVDGSSLEMQPERRITMRIR
ncbi:ribonuclease P protein component 1 [Methanoculleus bourgensis]|jgi:ribonuclease P protein subunit POP4|uniref:Ribonuclease P protein component 1 n=2 Tax=Methanoculleus bourgensis TaxID=83986 RepID=I7LMX7_METBM|nr:MULTISPECIES: ribonuclease P protein component 1 [Methanoculleus]MBT0732165.1 ribonuclease P protein component 1 [Methanoculleus bourgensis]MDD3373007.1 ribonuclease P protein component 1 [Methanoculleus bourgensis]NMA88040.1 ribonuclease P protein subunit [Methanoculleus bourgensis]NQS78534.1 ribonuclease P protein subunit [Methanoculleus bourgensis]CCJ36609.1 ribonuclease P subunit P29 [Methanoculleus bourgensis MS2]